MTPPPELHKGLKQRHLTMIAIGGVIGAGLFVGSGVVLQTTGPGAFLTYAVTGVLIIMVMRMLGEMATANPSTGSFSDYARAALGNWAGFSVAWLYWYFWVVVVGFEAVAGAGVMQFWLPDVPLWLMALVLMLLMTGTNLLSVGSYGEFEYWFAGIKVAAIIVFLLMGSLYVFGIISGDGTHFGNLTDHGGFLPEGGTAIFSSVVIVVFSMVGAEIATVAAAESHDPERAIARATNSVVIRVGTFYVGSLFLLACMIPWNSDKLDASPYVTAFEIIGIPGADDLMNAVVLTAVLSCLNSGLYTASRMLFVLAARREAPTSLLTVNGRGVPVQAILSSSVIGFLCVIAAYISPDTVFKFLLNSSGAIILFVYLLICISQFVLRRRTPDEALKVRMWGFPVLTLLTIAGILAILVQMGLTDETRSQLLLSLLAWGIILAAFGLNRLGRKDEADNPVGGMEGVEQGAAARQRDDVRGCVGTRARGCARRDRGPDPRDGAQQPRRHRAGRGRGCGVRLGGDPPGGAGAPGHDARCAACPGRRGDRSARRLPAAGGAAAVGCGVPAGSGHHLHACSRAVLVAAQGHRQCRSRGAVGARAARDPE